MLQPTTTLKVIRPLKKLENVDYNNLIFRLEMKTGLLKTASLKKSAWVPLFLVALAAATLKTSWATKEVATNSFYVKIHADPNQPDLAHKIARRNGFHNLGPVSALYIALLEKSHQRD